MGRGGDQKGNTQHHDRQESAEGVLRYYSWSQIKDSRNKWIVINDTVYDISKFYKKHPGGERLMLNHIGQDVTVMHAFIEKFIFLAQKAFIYLSLVSQYLGCVHGFPY